MPFLEVLMYLVYKVTTHVHSTNQVSKVQQGEPFSPVPQFKMKKLESLNGMLCFIFNISELDFSGLRLIFFNLLEN